MTRIKTPVFGGRYHTTKGRLWSRDPEEIIEIRSKLTPSRYQRYLKTNGYKPISKKLKVVTVHKYTGDTVIKNLGQRKIALGERQKVQEQGLLKSTLEQDQLSMSGIDPKKHWKATRTYKGKKVWEAESSGIDPKKYWKSTRTTETPITNVVDERAEKYERIIRKKTDRKLEKEFKKIQNQSTKKGISEARAIGALEAKYAQYADPTLEGSYEQRALAIGSMVKVKPHTYWDKNIKKLTQAELRKTKKTYTQKAKSRETRLREEAGDLKYGDTPGILPLISGRQKTVNIKHRKISEKETKKELGENTENTIIKKEETREKILLAPEQFKADDTFLGIGLGTQLTKPVKIKVGGKDLTPGKKAKGRKKTEGKIMDVYATRQKLLGPDYKGKRIKVFRETLQPPPGFIGPINKPRRIIDDPHFNPFAGKTSKPSTIKETIKTVSFHVKDPDGNLRPLTVGGVPVKRNFGTKIEQLGPQKTASGTEYNVVSLKSTPETVRRFNPKTEQHFTVDQTSLKSIKDNVKYRISKQKKKEPVQGLGFEKKQMVYSEIWSKQSGKEIVKRQELGFERKALNPKVHLPREMKKSINPKSLYAGMAEVEYTRRTLRTKPKVFKPEE